MTTQQIVFVLIGAVAVFAALAAFMIAYRQSSRDEAWRDSLEPDARKADRGVPSGILGAAPAARPAAEPATAVAVEERPAPPAEHAAEATLEVAPVRRVVEIPPAEAGVNRRQFFTRALTGTFFAFLGIIGLQSLSFAWPRVSGGFGSDINAGSLGDLRAQVFNPDGTITPLFLPEAKAYLVPISDEAVAGSQFDDNSTVVGGLMALFQKCVHLGCRVPWCGTSQGFECPCHGTKYNSAGEYEAGPAPRNLDRFVIFEEGGNLIIRTREIIPTERAQVKSVQYPQGPSCIG